GISLQGELIDLGVKHDIVEKSGAWYSYGKERIGQGKENVREFLKQNPDIANEIEARLRAELLPAKAGIETGAEAAAEAETAGVH
ncbi:MAG: hypothetical protein WBO57_00800, partial [Gammaproteobacteria bacterium]